MHRNPSGALPFVFHGKKRGPFLGWLNWCEICRLHAVDRRYPSWRSSVGGVRKPHRNPTIQSEAVLSLNLLSDSHKSTSLKSQEKIYNCFQKQLQDLVKVNLIRDSSMMCRYWCEAMTVPQPRLHHLNISKGGSWASKVTNTRHQNNDADHGNNLDWLFCMNDSRFYSYDLFLRQKRIKTVIPQHQCMPKRKIRCCKSARCQTHWSVSRQWIFLEYIYEARRPDLVQKLSYTSYKWIHFPVLFHHVTVQVREGKGKLLLKKRQFLTRQWFIGR